MAFRMIDFKCSNPACEEEFEDLTDATDGLADPKKCPKCSSEAPMIMNFDKRVHRVGNRYRDVSWSTWAIS